MQRVKNLFWLKGSVVVAGLLTANVSVLQAQAFAPGSGQMYSNSGDDFEDPNWTYSTHDPQGRPYRKSSDNTGHTGLIRSNNGRMIEGAKRGFPDYVLRVSPPEEGLRGSTGALVLQTRDNSLSAEGDKFPQDDIAIASPGEISIEASPSAVVYVYVPPVKQWEDTQAPNASPSFGFRATLLTVNPGDLSRGARKAAIRNGTVDPEHDRYWPGFFAMLDKKTGTGFWQVRSFSNGDEQPGPRIFPGWWTLGMSFTADGQVHYYAHYGIAPLSAQDHFASRKGKLQARGLGSVFFNVIKQTDSYASTPWVIDDPRIYAVSPGLQSSGSQHSQQQARGGFLGRRR